MFLMRVVMEDFVQYKKPCMTLLFPRCSFKCNKEAGRNVCQNWDFACETARDYPVDNLCKSYLTNDITKAICCQGLEPFDSFGELCSFIQSLRVNYNCDDDIVIYTGYNPEEIQHKVNQLKPYKNIIIKFGRFIPDRPHKYDEVLGVELASDNQYGVVLC